MRWFDFDISSKRFSLAIVTVTRWVSGGGTPPDPSDEYTTFPVHVSAGWRFSARIGRKRRRNRLKTRISRPATALQLFRTILYIYIQYIHIYCEVGTLSRTPRAEPRVKGRKRFYIMIIQNGFPIYIYARQVLLNQLGPQIIIIVFFIKPLISL